MTSASTTGASTPDYAGTWNLDIDQTSIEFHTKAMWILNVKGTAKALSGIATIDADGSVHGKLVIDATSINTGKKSATPTCRPLTSSRSTPTRPSTSR